MFIYLFLKSGGKGSNHEGQKEENKRHPQAGRSGGNM